MTNRPSERAMELSRAWVSPEMYETCTAYTDAQVDCARQIASAIEEAVAERDSIIKTLMGNLKETERCATVEQVEKTKWRFKYEEGLAAKDSRIEGLESLVKRLRNRVAVLRQEVNCRIEHGANHGGHLDYVEQKLSEALALNGGAERCLSPSAGLRPSSNADFAECRTSPFTRLTSSTKSAKNAQAAGTCPAARRRVTMPDPKTCGTCRWWEQYPDDPPYGLCTNDDANEAAEDWYSTDEGDGCRFHEEEEEEGDG